MSAAAAYIESTTELISPKEHTHKYIGYAKGRSTFQNQTLGKVHVCGQAFYNELPRIIDTSNLLLYQPFTFCCL